MRRRSALESAVEKALGARGGRLLVACSGGVDSTVLLHLARGLGLDVVAGHVNHGLRGAEADADEAFVAETAARLGCGFAVRRVDPGALRAGRSSLERPTLQEAARRLRYDALYAMADAAGAARIATAHTADDQAETLLQRLLRGTSPEGMGGIPISSADRRLIRPLLRVGRREIEACARERHIAWREDPSNRDPSYLRTRVRALLRELEADFNPRLLRALGDLAEAQQEEEAWRAALVEQEARWRFLADGDGLRIDAVDFADLPEALARRLARRALHLCGAGRLVSRIHVERVVAFLKEGRGGARLELPGGLQLTRSRAGICLSRAKLEGR